MEFLGWFSVNCKGAMLFCENSGERIKLLCLFIYLRLFLSLTTTAVTWIFFSSGKKKKRKLSTCQFLASLTKYKESFSCHFSRSFHSVICTLDDNSMCHIQLHHTAATKIHIIAIVCWKHSMESLFYPISL